MEVVAEALWRSQGAVTMIWSRVMGEHRYHDSILWLGSE